jgi:hypothetical protein
MEFTRNGIIGFIKEHEETIGKIFPTRIKIKDNIKYKIGEEQLNVLDFDYLWQFLL